MSSMFEGPSQPSRYFAAPPQRRLFWPKVIGAFATGVVVTILISKIPGDSSPVPPPVQSSKVSRVEAAKQREEASKAAQERKTATRAEASNDARPGELAGAVPPAAPRPESSTVSQSDSTTSAPASSAKPDVAKQADELNCAQQTWPYVDRKCAEANGNANQTTRPVRVVPTDRSAPSSVVTAAPPDATVPMPQPSPRTTDGSSSAPPPRQAERPRSTTGSAPVAEAPREAKPVAEAPREANRKEQAEPPVRPVPTATLPSRETTGHVTAASPDSLRETPPVTKQTGDRRQRRNASRRESEKNALSETRRSREDERTVRNRADDDEDDDTVVREHRLPDGRRVIIQRRPVDDDEDAGRRVIIQRRTADRNDDSGRRIIIQRRTNDAEDDDPVIRTPFRPRTPFFFDPTAPAE